MVAPSAQAEVHPRHDDEHRPAGVAALTVTALGIVYGDLGTNPLFALRECFHGPHALSTAPPSVLGALSLIFWSLIGVVSVKYLVFVLRAENDGEGGTLALLARVSRRDEQRRVGRTGAFALVMLFGSALLFGDGVVTPAVSVLSAVEGLTILPSLAHAVVPITVGILAVLFMVQRRGTHKVGRVFGPVMVLWFLSIGVLGAIEIVRQPRVLHALNPLWALRLLIYGGPGSFFVLGAVVLCVAGGEALYADMGHFGRRPIAIAWYSLVLPSLVLNYFGQGALLLRNPNGIESPFYALVPRPVYYPMVALATAATVIASQALISGAFSLTRQAVQLGYWPRVNIIHTSETETGQIFVPSINIALAACCIAIVLGFKTSEALAAAYGLAVTGTMVVTSIGFFGISWRIWRWRLVAVLAVAVLFLSFDLSFLIANIPKIFEGGWVPLIIGICAFTLMTTWMRGRMRLGELLSERAMPAAQFFASPSWTGCARVRGTAVFLTGQTEGIPAVVQHHIEHNRVVRENMLLLTIVSHEVPYVDPRRRIKTETIHPGVFRVVAEFGFMELPNVPAVLEACAILGLPIDVDDLIYYVGRDTLLSDKRGGGLWRWRKRLFSIVSRNARSAVEYFGIPPERVVELGLQVQL
jgi:KUP system potassium uptake protein